MHGPNLRLLLHNKRRSALRARLRHRHKRCSEVAIRIPRATIKNPRTPSSTLPRAPTPHKLALTALRALDPHGDRPRVLALGISRAPNKLPEPPMLLDQMIP